MLGEISHTVQIRAQGMRRVVPELQVFPQALAEWGHGLAPRGHPSTPSRHKGEHGGVTRVSHHPRRSHCGADSGPRRDAGQEGGDGQTGGPYYPNAVSGFVQGLLCQQTGVCCALIIAAATLALVQARHKHLEIEGHQHTTLPTSCCMAIRGRRGDRMLSPQLVKTITEALPWMFIRF
jgi:hypothetical protein